jgi:peptide/nickel transport system substrate-binding protein
MIAKSEVTFFRGSWIADYPDAENYLSLFYSKNFAPKGPNYTHFKNAGYDSLFEKARSEVNDSIRFEYYRAMDKIIVNEAVVIVLYYDKALRFTQNNIFDLGTNPMNLLTLKRVKKKNVLK